MAYEYKQDFETQILFENQTWDDLNLEFFSPAIDGRCFNHADLYINLIASSLMTGSVAIFEQKSMDGGATWFENIQNQFTIEGGTFRNSNQVLKKIDFSGNLVRYRALFQDAGGGESVTLTLFIQRFQSNFVVVPA